MSQSKKIVIVTGGTRGIGRAIVKTLIVDGYYVIATGTKVVSYDDYMPDEGSVHFFRLDLGSSSSISDCVDRMFDGFGDRDFYGLVNNAGICEASSMYSQESFMESWRRVIDVNLTGAAEFTHRIISRPKVHPLGRIVNIASQLGKFGRAGYSAYCASKFGLIGLTEVWSREFAPRGTTVNAVCPGWIETDMTAQDLARMAKEMGKDPAPFRPELESCLDQRRFNTPEEVASIVAFLLSPASSGITGRAIEMAGPSA